MAVTVERLIATLEARFDKYDKALNRSLGHTNRTFTRIERRGKQLESRMATIGGNVGRRFVAAFAAGISVRAFQQLTDAATRINNALKIAGLSGDELEEVYGRLRDSAVKNAAPLEGLVELYSRLALVQKDLGKSSGEISNFAETVAVALRVGGRPASETAGALLQLSQALGEGIVRSQEFNSLIEGAPALLQAAAAGIKEAEGSVAKLRQIMLDGELSSRAFFDGIVAGTPLLESKVTDATYSIGQAMGNMHTALVDAARDFEKATGAGEDFAGGINNVAEAIADVDIDGFIQRIRDARSELEKFFDNLANAGLVERFAETVTGLDLTVGKPVSLETVEAQKELANLERQIGILKDRIEANKTMAIDTAGAEDQLNDLLARANALRAILASPETSRTGSGFVGSPELPANQPKRPAPAEITPVSLDDYAAPDAGKKGSGRSSAARLNDFEREVKLIKERTAAIQSETTAMLGLDPLVKDYGYALEKAAAKHQLLAAAQEAGLKITPELESSIEQLAEGYAHAGAEAARLAEAQDEARERMEEMRDLGRDVMSGFIRDLQNGRSASEALAGALSKVGDKLLDIAMTGAWGGSGSGGGLFGGLLGGLFGRRDPWAGLRVPGFAAGTSYAPGGPAVVGERGPELVNLPRGAQVIPNHRIGGSISAPISINIDARGADNAGLARVQAQLASLKTELPSHVIATVRRARQERKL